VGRGLFWIRSDRHRGLLCLPICKAAPSGFPPGTRTGFLFLGIFVFGLLAVSLSLLQSPFCHRIQWVLALGVCLEGLYYMNNLHPVRTNRDQHMPEAMNWVKRRIPSPGGNRVLNIGGSGIMPNWGGGLQIPEAGAMEVSIVRGYRNFYEKQIGRGLFLSLSNPAGELRFTRESLRAGSPLCDCGPRLSGSNR